VNGIADKTENRIVNREEKEENEIVNKAEIEIVNKTFRPKSPQSPRMIKSLKMIKVKIKNRREILIINFVQKIGF
jgi:hypothetical protein